MYTDNDTNYIAQDERTAQQEANRSCKTTRRRFKKINFCYRKIVWWLMPSMLKQPKGNTKRKMHHNDEKKKMTEKQKKNWAENVIGCQLCQFSNNFILVCFVPLSIVSNGWHRQDKEARQAEYQKKCKQRKKRRIYTTTCETFMRLHLHTGLFACQRPWRRHKQNTAAKPTERCKEMQ